MYCKPEDLEECFSAVGKVVNTFLVFENGRPKGYGFVAFSTPEEAQEAVKRFNGYEMTVRLTNTTSKRKILVKLDVSNERF